jgi:hypothetical protein
LGEQSPTGMNNAKVNFALTLIFYYSFECDTDWHIKSISFRNASYSGKRSQNEAQLHHRATLDRPNHNSVHDPLFMSNTRTVIQTLTHSSLGRTIFDIA